MNNIWHKSTLNQGQITSQFRVNLINAVGEQGNWGESRNPYKMAELLKKTSGFS